MKKYLLELELTNNCNARCVMCPVINMNRKKGFMTRETFKLIVKKGIRYGIQTIRFCGLGEPLLHKNFCYFLSYLNKNSCFKTELITNGSLLSEKTVRCLIENNIDFLSISFPSLTKDSYEKIMKGLIFKNVLKKVVFAIHEIKNTSNTHIKITSVVTGINCDEITNIKHFWTQKGVDCIQIHTPHNRGGYLKDIAHLNHSSDIDNVSNFGAEKSLCPWPLRQFFVAWDGSVFLCCCDMEGMFSVGKVYLNDFSEMEIIQEEFILSKPILCKRCSYQKARVIM